MNAERQEFIALIKAELPKEPEYLVGQWCRHMMRLATAYRRLSSLQTMTDKQWQALARACRRIRTACDAYAFQALFRCGSVVLHVPSGKTNDQNDSGIVVPHGR